MDPEKTKRLATFLLSKLKELETELVAYRMVFLAATQVLEIPDLGRHLELAKQRAAQGMDQKYDDMMERFQHIIDQDTLDQELEEFLKSWNPEGPAN